MSTTLFKKTIVPSIIAILLVGVIQFMSCNKDTSPGSTHFKCVTCGNGGACINDTCRCTAGFEGLTCETSTRQKFLGSWNVIEKIGADSASYFINIQQDNSSVFAVVIRSLFNEVDTMTVSGYITGDSLLIPMQYVNGRMIVGSGYFSGNQTTEQSKITMRYAVKDMATNTVIDFGYYSAATSPSLWLFLPTGLL